MDLARAERKATARTWFFSILLKQLPCWKLKTAIADAVKTNPGAKPMEIRNLLWAKGIHCVRRDIRYALGDPELRNESLGNSVAPSTDEDLFPIRDLQALSEMVARHGKAKVTQVIEAIR